MPILLKYICLGLSEEECDRLEKEDEEREEEEARQRRRNVLEDLQHNFDKVLNIF